MSDLVCLAFKELNTTDHFSNELYSILDVDINSHNYLIV